MSSGAPNLLVVLGPTATGKTRLGVRLAQRLGGEIVSADSRQVYRGLDLGTGKDLQEYEVEGGRIPCHLIDVTDPSEEFSVFDFQTSFHRIFEKVRARGVLPVLVGGTGLYLESVLLGYRMVEAPGNPVLRAELEELPDADLAERLRTRKESLHNVTDLESRERMIRAIEIAEQERSHEPAPAPDTRPLVLGTRWPRDVLKRRIRERLVQRLDAGLVEEVKGLRARGMSWERLHALGLEYRFVADRLRGKIKNRNDLVQKLHAAICRFAKRQESWFRRMERHGVAIHWIDRGDFDRAWEIVQTHMQSG